VPEDARTQDPGVLQADHVTHDLDPRREAESGGEAHRTPRAFAALTGPPASSR
jgi:hypothetical protein